MSEFQIIERIDSTSSQKMSPYGGEDLEECDSMMSYSVLQEDGEIYEQTTNLRSQIVNKLKKNKKTLNILVIGPAGVGKSSFVNTLGAALSGHWHEYAYSGRYGGAARPMTFFMQRYTDCCLTDPEYKEPYKDVTLPTLLDVAGFPDEDNTVYEEILRTIMYGRLPEEESIMKAADIGRKGGVDSLRKAYPTMDEELKVDRVLFLASASEGPIPEKLISCVVNAARPPGTMDNSKKRSIPIFGVITKADTVDVGSPEFKAREEKFIQCLGLEGCQHRYTKCSNYCSMTAPERTEVIYPELDLPILRLFKQLVDPFITVMSSGESDDYSHLVPQKPKEPFAPGINMKYVSDTLLKVSKNPMAFFTIVASTFGLLCLACFLSSGPVVDMKNLHSACTRMRDNSHEFNHFTELHSVCESLDNHGFACYKFFIVGTVLLLIFSAIYFFRYKQNQGAELAQKKRK